MMIWPTTGNVTGEFNPNRGVVGDLGDLGAHTGIDIGAPTGTPVTAAMPGTVARVWWDTYNNGVAAGGNMVEISHGNGLATRYAHLDTVSAKVGERVQFDVIGTVGATGMVTGAHLHFEVLEHGVHVNPRKYLDKSTTELETTEMHYLILQKKHTYLITPQGSGKPRAILLGNEAAGANLDPRLPVIRAHSASFTMEDLKKCYTGLRASHLTPVK